MYTIVTIVGVPIVTWSHSETTFSEHFSLSLC